MHSKCWLQGLETVSITGIGRVERTRVEVHDKVVETCPYSTSELDSVSPSEVKHTRNNNLVFVQVDVLLDFYHRENPIKSPEFSSQLIS
jgi:hypothetical protein